MTQVTIEYGAIQAIMDDPRLQRARRKLSFHELRLIVQHVQKANTINFGLCEALSELLKARSKDPHEIIGTHPVDGHPLNAEGAAALKAEAALRNARGEEA